MNITELNNCYKLHRTLEKSGTSIEIYNAKDSTAQGLTIYGRSEVVDGVIKSVGEGYAIVDLGTLEWEYISDSAHSRFEVNYLGIKRAASLDDKANILCAKYDTRSSNDIYNHIYNKSIAYHGTLYKIWVYDTTYTDATAFKTAMSGVLLCYQLADPTQGNAIAVKTDDGTGINGTMATFTTALPLRGISDTARDKLICTAGVKQAETVCGKVKLTDLTWSENSSYPGGFLATLSNVRFGSLLMLSNYSYDSSISFSWSIFDTLEEHTIYRSSEQTNDKIYIKATEYTGNLTNFIASLGDAELVYELAAPIITLLTTTEISQTENLQTFNPQTNVQNSSNAEMTIKYNRRVPN